MTPIESFFFGILLGFLGVGLPTLRTIKTMEGKYLQVGGISLLSSLSMFVFMRMIVVSNYPFLFGNAIGAAISVIAIAYKRNRDADKD